MLPVRGTAARGTAQRRGVGGPPPSWPGARAPASLCQDPKSGQAPILLARNREEE